MSSNSKQALTIGIIAAIALTAFLVSSLLLFGASIPIPTVSANEPTIRWDINSVTIVPAGGPPPTSVTATVNPGGTQTANDAVSNSITFTGSGTFKPAHPDEVTGGGTWAITGGDPGGPPRGKYTVVELISFELAPGTLPSSIPGGCGPGCTVTIIDNIGANADARAGVAVLRIAYSDGSTGVLVVSCKLPAGTPSTVLEGVTATKGFVDFFDPTDPTDADLTTGAVFHIVP